MKRPLQVLIGSGLGLLCLLLSVLLLGFVAGASHLPFYTSELFVFLPFVVALGFAFRKLFTHLPVLYAFLSMLIALVVSFGGAWTSPGEVLGALGATPH